MAEFVIADTHFGDANILHFAQRPFKNITDMNNCLVASWNNVVSDDDIVYIIGDFVDPVYDMATAEAVLQLKGHKYLIRGNHDTLSDEEYFALGIERVYDFPILKDGFYVFSHEPIFLNKAMPYANIFGHVHNNPIYQDFGKQFFCVSVERNALHYAPIELNKVYRLMREVPND